MAIKEQRRSDNSLDQFLHRWRNAIASAPRDVPVAELGTTGQLLFRDVGGEEGEDRPLFRTVLAVLAAAVGSTVGATYRRRAELLADVDALRAACAVPPTRRSIVEALHAGIAGAAAGDGGTFLLVGESGVGKTHLWTTVLRDAMPSVGLYAAYKGLQTGSAPYSAAGALIRGLLPAAPNEASRRLTAVLQRTARFQRAARFVRQLAIPDTRSAVDEPTTTSPPPDVFGVIAACLKQLAREHMDTAAGAVAVAIDDAQWLDEQSAAVVAELIRAPGPLFCVVLSRTEVFGTGESGGAGWARLEELSPAEARVLARALASADPDGLPDARTEAVLAAGGGNPFRIAESVRQLTQIRGLGGTEPPDDPDEPSSMRLSPPATAVLEATALLLPPVDGGELHRALDGVVPDWADALEECIDTGVLVRRASTLAFTHDQLEAAARRAALVSDWWVPSVGRTLAERAQSGDERSVYVFARAIASRIDRNAPDINALPVELFLSDRDMVGVLVSAAERAIGLAIADEALRFVEVALDRHATAVDRETRNHLALVGHRAAFLRDDAEGMSRYYRIIAAVGTDEDRAAARQLWISRCYAKLWIRGAIRIGWNTLRDLGALGEATADEAARWTRRHRPRRVYRRILAAGVDTSSRRQLVSRTCASLILPAMSLEPESAATLAMIILRSAVRWGSTPHVAVGFVYWALDVHRIGGALRRRQLLSRLGRQIMEETVEREADPIQRHRTRTFVSILTMPWERLRPREYRYLFDLYREGVRIGSFETAAHAIHVFCYAPLFHGYPLDQVYRTIETYRTTVEDLGLARISTAMVKFAQVALVLAGRTEEPLRLAGHLCEESALERELVRSGDALGLAGLRYIQAMIATHHGDAHMALERLRVVDAGLPLAAFLVDTTWAWFHHGIVAAKLGLHREAARQRRRLRRVADTHPGSFRYLALRAESAAARIPRRGDRLFRRAFSDAVGAGHIHDAAVIAERHADLLERVGRPVEAHERIVAAAGLYRRWGARLPAEAADDRIRRYRVEQGLELPGTASHAADTQDSPPGSGPGPSVEALTLRRTRDYAHVLFATIEEAVMLVEPPHAVVFHNTAAEPYVLATPSGGWRLADELAFVVSDIEGAQAGSGELMWNARSVVYAARAVPGEDPPGRVAVVLRDITDARTREQQLVLADRLSSLGMMAATIAHEVGNPNHIISLNAQVIASMDVPAAVRDAAAGIQEGAQRISEVVSHVTRYARGGRDQLPEWIDPAELGARVERFTRVLVRTHTGALRFDAAADLPSVRAFPAMLEQALVNLIKNACEALPDRTSLIALRIRADGDAVVFEVCDQGHGVPAELLRRAGPKVFRTSKAESGGSGLGVSIVRSIAELHGGTLRYRSDDTFATIAAVRIPVDGPPESREHAASVLPS